MAILHISITTDGSKTDLWSFSELFYYSIISDSTCSNTRRGSVIAWECLDSVNFLATEAIIHICIAIDKLYNNPDNNKGSELPNLLHLGITSDRSNTISGFYIS